MLVKKLSKFIVGLDYEDIPKTAINKLKICFLDFLGVSKRGFNEKTVQILLKSLEEMEPNKLNINNDFSDNNRSSIIGKGYSNVYNAGFINGVSAHCLDLDDGHRFAQIHPGTIIFPTALAISEKNDINGKKFLESIICGYEIAIVLGTLVNPYHRDQGFHTTGTIGTFASGATASKLLGLSMEKTINVLGLCGTLSSGLLESNHQGTMGKQLHAGKTVYNGILSGYLAKNEFTGSETIVDGNEGFLKAMVIKKFEDMNYSAIQNYINSYLENSLGKFHIKEVYLKKYPFCRHLHSSIDSIINIKDKHDFNMEDTIKITIKTYKIATEHDNFNPKNKEELKQSLPYAVAMSCFKGNDMSNLENYNNYNYDTYDLETIKSILNKISIEESEEFTKLTPNYRPSNVIIETDKNNYEVYVELPKGEPENPFTKKDILKKFKSLNPDFNLNKLKPINELESINIRNFMKSFNHN
ncbi:hypothetical protein ALNOE001_03770 [Candidatus Methanobinarius endosymbioticus]|uniref:2-methylcitrate dehydratase n=1 Tax=Candidatus Methanobinarius endosymbioticus TaxID=2006182 RepID=A0A366MFM3_9EURY|nr:hypothetical protein ALNOE001_03770 [Candidatus Methanobinarius endosymbioticus]